MRHPSARCLPVSDDRWPETAGNTSLGLGTPSFVPSLCDCCCFHNFFFTRYVDHRCSREVYHGPHMYLFFFLTLRRFKNQQRELQDCKTKSNIEIQEEFLVPHLLSKCLSPQSDATPFMRKKSLYKMFYKGTVYN